MKINKVEILCLLLYLMVLFFSCISFSVREDLLYVVDVLFWNGGILYLKVYMAIPAIYFASCLIDPKYSLRVYVHFLLMCYLALQNIIAMLVGIFYIKYETIHMLLFFVNFILFFAMGFYFYNAAKNIQSSIAATIVALSSLLVFVPHIFFLLNSLKP